MAKVIYYVDSNATYAANHANDGIDDLTPWGGAGGVQRALALAVAPDDVLIKNGADLDESLLVKVTHAAVTGGFALDDFVIETTDVTDGDPPDAGGGQGYVVYVQSTTVTWIHVTAGVWNTTASRYVWHDAANYSGAISAVAKPGISPVTSGTAAAGIVSVIGVNGSWVEDGTRAVFDGNNAASSCVNANSISFLQWRNIELKRATGNATAYGAALHSQLWINCSAHNNGAYGFEGTYAGISAFPSMYIGCIAYSNTTVGIGNSYNGSFYWMCVSYGNTTHGCVLCPNSRDVWIDCLSHDNGGNAFHNTGAFAHLLIGCILDKSDDAGDVGFNSTAGCPMLLGCRVTNNVTGLAIAANMRALLGWCYFGGNTGADTSGNYDIINYKGDTTHVVFAGADTNHGYTDQTTDDFNLRTDASLRNTAIPLPVA